MRSFAALRTTEMRRALLGSATGASAARRGLPSQCSGGIRSLLRSGPAIEALPLGLALLLERLLEVVAIRRGVERAVGRIGNDQPFAAEAVLVLVERLQPVGLARAVAIVEVAEIVADV